MAACCGSRIIEPDPAAEDYAPGDRLRFALNCRAVCGEIAGELGKAFQPDRVLFVSALPKTRSAKIVRRAVRAKALGTDPGDLSSLENPETLEEIANAV